CLLLALAAAIVATTAKRSKLTQSQPIVIRPVAAKPLSDFPNTSISWSPGSIMPTTKAAISLDVAAANLKPATNPVPAKKSGGGPPKEPLKDPDARVALSLVGIDSEAEAYWFGAINDPSLSANEREDLIEDLNEEGFTDPKHPTPDELPLILRRLELIEMLAPYAMDEVNLA